MNGGLPKKTLETVQTRLFPTHWLAVQLLRMLASIEEKKFTHLLATYYQALMPVLTSRGGWLW